MNITKETIEGMLPEFEAAVFDPLVDLMFGEITEKEELEKARTYVSVMNHCRETAEAGKSFFAQRLGFYAVRHEMHTLPDQHHHFLSVMRHPEQITDEDLVIDPTYLQYARSSDVAQLMQDHPRVFVGVRAAITALMLKPAFEGIDAARLYAPSTLRTIS